MALLVVTAAACASQANLAPVDDGACRAAKFEVDRKSKFLARFRNSGMGHRSSWDYGFIATPAATLCWSLGLGDSGSSCDSGNETDIDLPHDPSSDALARTRTALVSALGKIPPPGEYCAGPPLIVVSARAGAGKRRVAPGLRVVLDVVREVIAAKPELHPVVVKAEVSAVGPVDQGVRLSVGRGTTVGVWSGITVAAGATPNQRARLEALAKMPYAPDMGFHIPIIEFDLRRDGKSVKIAGAQWADTLAERRRQGPGFDDRDVGLYKVFKALCEPALASRNRVPEASCAPVLGRTTRAQQFRRYFEKQYEQQRR